MKKIMELNARINGLKQDISNLLLEMKMIQDLEEKRAKVYRSSLDVMIDIGNQASTLKYLLEIKEKLENKENRTMTFNTGREYSPEGQIIRVEEFNGPYEEIDFFNLSEENSSGDQYIIFEDTTRNIKGKIEWCAFDQDKIVARYDSREYTEI